MKQHHHVSIGFASLILSIGTLGCGSSSDAPDAGSSNTTGRADATVNPDASLQTDGGTADTGTTFVATRHYSGPCRLEETLSAASFGTRMSRLEFTYDANERPTMIEILANEFTPVDFPMFTFAYDAAGRLVRIANPSMPPVPRGCTDDMVIQTLTWDSSGRLVRAETDNMISIECGSIADGDPERTTLFTYDAAGLIEREDHEIELFDQIIISKTEYTRDSSDRITKIETSREDPPGTWTPTNTTTLSYEGTPNVHIEPAFGAVPIVGQPRAIEGSSLASATFAVVYTRDGECTPAYQECSRDGTIDETIRIEVENGLTK